MYRVRARVHVYMCVCGARMRVLCLRVCVMSVFTCVCVHVCVLTTNNHTCICVRTVHASRMPGGVMDWVTRTPRTLPPLPEPPARKRGRPPKKPLIEPVAPSRILVQKVLADAPQRQPPPELPRANWAVGAHAVRLQEAMEIWSSKEKMTAWLSQVEMTRISQKQILHRDGDPKSCVHSISESQRTGGHTTSRSYLPGASSAV